EWLRGCLRLSPYSRSVSGAARVTTRSSNETTPRSGSMQSVMKLGLAFVLALVVLVPLATWLTGVKPPGQSPAASPPLPPIVQVQSMSELATTRVRIADCIDGENENWRVKWVLHGEVVLGVDLSQAQYAEVSEGNRTATLSLPLPHLISSKVDHE